MIPQKQRQMITSKEEFDAEIKKALAPLVEAVKEAQKEALDKLVDVAGVNAYSQPEAKSEQSKGVGGNIKAIGFLRGHVCGGEEMLFACDDNKSASVPHIVIIGDSGIGRDALVSMLQKSIAGCTVAFSNIDTKKLEQAIIDIRPAGKVTADEIQKIADELARADKKLTKQIPHGIPWDKKRDFKRRK